MKHRAEAATRVVRVKAQMAKLAEWRRLKSEQDLLAAERARADLHAFADAALATGALARTIVAQADRLGRDRDRASVVRDRLVVAHETAQRQLKTAETLAEDLVRQAGAERERRALELLIEQFGQRGSDPTSLP